MKTGTVTVVVGAVFAAIFISARAAESNAPPIKMLPARSMLTMGGIVTTPQRKPSPIFAGKELPVPPEQHARWSPPKTDLPTNYVSATALLFQQGMADPRGCDYRVIEVGTGNVWTGDGGVVETHGWVLPGRHTQPFAVCWNGMVYPVVSVGTNADLKADVDNLLTNGFTTWYSAIPEGMSVSQKSLLGIKGCLLLRLGKTDLARRYWLAEMQRVQAFRNSRFPPAMRAKSMSGTPEIQLPDTDPYLTWATEWAWAMFDRTICAHERGDEMLALDTARQLAAAQPQIEAACVRRGFQRQPYYDYQHRGQKKPYLDFLGQFPQILADLERRAKEPKEINFIEAGITNYPDQSRRIALLIEDLDLVQARQFGQPGWVNLADDPIVTALTHEGDPAVEPLLKCLETDKRLTRSVGFGRDFARGRTVIPVHDVAKFILESILRARFNGGASEIRAYWNKYKNLPLQDRWYAILDDDSARARWAEAAANIVQPNNVRSYPGGLTMTKPAPTNAPVRMAGEILRAKTNPSVSELMARRALEVPTNNINSYHLAASCQMALYLAAWDPAASLPVTRTLSERARTVMEYSSQQLGPLLTKLALARAKAGDPEAFDDYARWIVTTTPKKLDVSLSACLEPFKAFPTNATLVAAAKNLFGNTNSAWSRLPWKGTFGNNDTVVNLVHVPAFRLLLVRELERTNVCGTFRWNGPGQISYEITNYQSGSYGAIAFPSGTQPANGTTSELRWCDWIAFLLSNGRQIPFFNPFAPVEERNTAIAEAKKLLEQP